MLVALSQCHCPSWLKQHLVHAVPCMSEHAPYNVSAPTIPFVGLNRSLYPGVAGSRLLDSLVIAAGCTPCSSRQSYQLPTCCQPHWLVARRHRGIIAGLTVRNSCICSGDVFASVRAQSCSRPAQHSTAARVIVCTHVVTCSALHLSGLFYTAESLILKHLRKARVLLALCCCALDRVLEDGACVVAEHSLCIFIFRAGRAALHVAWG